MPLRHNNIDGSQLSAVSRLFSASVVRELSRKGHSPLFTRLAEEARLFDYMKQSEPVGQIFDAAFALLRKKNNRHEYVYKAALTHKVLLGTHSLKTAAMMNEFRIGDCKADAVILNGTGSVYEIKSERDSLSRLSKQISTYRTVFAKVNVITGENHLASVFSTVPDDVGIMLLSDRFQISTIREAIDCPERTNPVAVFDSIQMHEAKAILKLLNINIPDLPNTKIYAEIHRIFSNLDPTDTHMCMVKVLKKTRSLISLSKLAKELPESLLAAAFSTKIRKSDYSNLVEAVRTPISEAKKWN